MATFRDKLRSMKATLAFLLFTALSAQTLFSQNLSCRDYQGIVTYNIRYNNPGDGVNSWPNRKEKVFSLLRAMKPRIICLQEVLNNQLKDLAAALPDYDYVGVGRDDGREAGEYVPVFYLRNCFSEIKHDHFWLSTSPDKPGVLGWDAACTRMVTWISLVDKQKGDTLFVFNTHFDHVGEIARQKSAEMLTHAADSIAGDHIILITGDLNSTPEDKSYQIILKSGYLDSRPASVTSPAGPEYTFTGFSRSGKPGGRIDYVFFRNLKKIKSYGVRDDHDGMNYYSDHLPVKVGF